MSEPILPLVNNSSVSESSLGDRVIPLPTNSRDRLSSYFVVDINGEKYDERLGQILGNPYLHSATNEHTSGEIWLEDPDSKIFQKIKFGDSVTITAGFTDTAQQEVFRGSIKSLGRRAPETTTVQIIDRGYSSKSFTPGVVDSQSGTNPLDLTVTTDSQDITAQIANYSALNQEVTTYKSLAEAATDGRLSFDNGSNLVVGKQGEVVWSESALGAATREANLVGDKIVVEGDTLRRVSPDLAPQLNITLDYLNNREVFLGTPRVSRRNPQQINSPYGGWQVQGWDINSKSLIQATVVVPENTSYNPDTVITILGQQVRLGDPILPNNLFTWGDATKNGSRIPETSQIVSRIRDVAQVLDSLNREVGGDKFIITSWYRTPKANRAAKGSDRSRHLFGDAVDVFFNGMERLFNKLEPTYNGGLAIAKNSFLHIDTRGHRARWNY